MRKQKHLDDLVAQVAQLRKENNQIIQSVNTTTQHYMNIETENSILRAQASELSHRLQALNDIINFLNANTGVLGASGVGDSSTFSTEPIDSFMNPWSLSYLNQPITATADIFNQY